jgi:hypothetical protein
MNDAQILLETCAPVLRLNEGEEFFPMMIWLALRPLSCGVAFLCAIPVLIWLGLGYVAAYWGQLPGLIIRAASKLNQRRRDAARDQYNLSCGTESIYAVHSQPGGPFNRQNIGGVIIIFGCHRPQGKVYAQDTVPTRL